MSITTPFTQESLRVWHPLGVKSLSGHRWRAHIQQDESKSKIFEPFEYVFGGLLGILSICMNTFWLQKHPISLYYYVANFLTLWDEMTET